jgi:hypothetical protein
MRRALSITQVFLSLIAVFILVVSCEKLTSTSSTSIPASSNSTYPADISGNVIIPEFLYVRDVTMWKSEGESDVFWVVEISIRNTSYEHDITLDCKNWQIMAGGEVYPLGEGLMRALRYKEVPYQDDWNIPTGQSGKIAVCFSVPDTLKVSDAILCYQGQEPYSYGKLTGGDLVEAYDWDSRIVTQLRN